MKNQLTITVRVLSLCFLFVACNNEHGAWQSGKKKSRSTGYYYEDVKLQEKEVQVPNGTYNWESPEEGGFDKINHNTEEYETIVENTFLAADKNPLSTFSIDVDNASYSNVRRFVENGQWPYSGSVRTEELINYFDYAYAEPSGQHPFTVDAQLAQCPWNEQNQLLKVGLKGKSLDYEELNPSNLVFLVDVSGSMDSKNKLPLLQQSFKMMVDNLPSNSRVAIVTYAGNAGLVLPSTSVDEKETIIRAIDNLNAGGSTAGKAGIELAYKIATENFVQGGNNRVILATDGDFNVGVSNTADLVNMIKEKKKNDIYLTICGFGMGNYKDGRMEQISNAGNGNYFYIDGVSEARKVFDKELLANMFTIAKDVKIQIEFNPNTVNAYRLIGYENRLLADEDFNDDKIDAGELGAGHTVTALYEIIPSGVESDEVRPVDALKFQNVKRGSDMSSLAVLKLRYKPIDSEVSKLMEQIVAADAKKWNEMDGEFNLAASAAGWGMFLNKSKYSGDLNLPLLKAMAKTSLDRDENGHRAEFLALLSKTEHLKEE